MLEVGLDRGGTKWLLRVQVDKRTIVEDVLRYRFGLDGVGCGWTVVRDWGFCGRRRARFRHVLCIGLLSQSR